jgi:hypothetical protein
MQTYIGHLHCRYRVTGKGTSTTSVSRLERIAREGLLEAYAAALQDALGDDEAVYVVQDIGCRLALPVGSNSTDEQLARRWADGLAKSISRKVSSPDETVMRFDNQVDYVAHFLNDLLQGTAWQHWYYGSFSSLRSTSLTQVVETILSEYKAQSMQILAALHRLNALERLLARLDPEALRRLGFSSRPADSYSSKLNHPLLAFGLQLCDRLDLWAGRRAGPADLDSYLQTASIPANWRDSRSLAMALHELLRFLDTHHYLRRPPATGFAERLEDALRDMDWLDTVWLRSALLGWPSASSPEDLPVRTTADGLTPRQRLLLSAIMEVVERWGDSLDHQSPTSAANLARLAAWLTAEDSSWAGDQAVQATLSRLLAAWEELQRNPSSANALRQAKNPRGSLSGNLGWVSRLGAPGVAILGRLMDGENTASSLPTGCAGTALLLRALTDSHLPSALKGLAFPGAETSAGLPALLPILLCWAGDSGILDGHIDPTLLTLAGVDSLNLTDLQQLWQPIENSAALQDFERSCLRLLAAQRLLSADLLNVHLIAQEDGHAVILGNADGLFPLGGWIRSLDQAPELLAGLLASWEEVENLPESIYVPLELAGQLNKPRNEQAGLPLRWHFIPLQTEDQSELARVHSIEQEHLLAALSQLSTGRLGLPQIDLKLALLAASLLRLWARWLRNFSTSSIPYLLGQFIRRAGQMRPWPYPTLRASLQFELEPRPLDLVLEMAGYLAPLESVPWLDGRIVEFEIHSP